MRGALPESVRDPLDYAREGRVFCGIELYEGEEIAKSINELLGDGVIMYQSDYPHNGCEFPSSPDIALSWTGIGEQAMRKLMYDNAARYLRMG
jgi:predicted TIM-barrel fold metal-dependent hydrolase